MLQLSNEPDKSRETMMKTRLMMIGTAIALLTVGGIAQTQQGEGEIITQEEMEREEKKKTQLESHQDMTTEVANSISCPLFSHPLSS